MSSSPPYPWWRWIINTPHTIRRAGLFAGTLALLLATGCRQDMHDQPKFIPQRGTDFYADGRSARPQVENTVARGQLHTDTYFYTGFANGKEGDGLPFPATLEVLERGQERYNVYCTPCHSRVGNGVGMIVQRGYAPAGNLHTNRLRTAPLGHFFNVISNGYGAMPDYSAQIAPVDRWAITAYIRALQLSQDARQSDVASGSHVQPLSEIEQDEGFPAGFAQEWALPPTGVKGGPNNSLYVFPEPGSPAPAAGAAASSKSTPSPAPSSAPAKPAAPQL